MPFLTTLFTIPSSTTVFTDISGWSTELFTDILPIALVGVGLLIAGMGVSFLMGKAVGGVKKVTGGGRGGRRGRRGR